MKFLFVSLLSVLAVSCNSAQNSAQNSIQNNSTSVNNASRIDYANSITADELKTHLYIFAGDAMEGRMTGQKRTETSRRIPSQFLYGSRNPLSH